MWPGSKLHDIYKGAAYERTLGSSSKWWTYCNSMPCRNIKTLCPLAEESHFGVLVYAETFLE